MRFGLVDRWPAGLNPSAGHARRRACQREDCDRQHVFGTTKFGSVAGGDRVADEFGNRLNDVVGTPSASELPDEATNRARTYPPRGFVPSPGNPRRLVSPRWTGTRVPFKRWPGRTHSINRPPPLRRLRRRQRRAQRGTHASHEVSFTVATDVVLHRRWLRAHEQPMNVDTPPWPTTPNGGPRRRR